MKREYLENVKDRLLEMNSGGDEYWAEEDRISGQAKMIREAGFLNEVILDAIEKELRQFRGDKWEMTDMLAKLCRKEPAELPSVEVFAIFVLYLFYNRDLEMLRS